MGSGDSWAVRARSENGIGASKMTLRGLYRWSRDEDGGGGAAPEHDAPVDFPARNEPETGREPGPGAAEEELEIEKKQFRLAGIDPEKFDWFFDKYYDRIFAYAYWQTGDHDTAADVASETFQRAWEKRRRFRWQGYTFGAWLFQIARRVLSHHRRRERTRGETEFVPERDDLPVEAVGTTRIERDLDAELIRRALRELKPDPFEVVVLHHFVGMTTKQIAIVTQRPEGTVKSHLRRARTVLGRWLAQHGPQAGLSDRALQIVQRALADQTGLKLVKDETESSDEEAPGTDRKRN